MLVYPWGESSQGFGGNCVSIPFQAIINNFEKKISRIFVIFTEDTKKKTVIILNKEISTKTIVNML